MSVVCVTEGEEREKTLPFSWWGHFKVRLACLVIQGCRCTDGHRGSQTRSLLAWQVRHTQHRGTADAG